MRYVNVQQYFITFIQICSIPVFQQCKEMDAVPFQFAGELTAKTRCFAKPFIHFFMMFLYYVNILQNQQFLQGKQQKTATKFAAVTGFAFLCSRLICLCGG